ARATPTGTVRRRTAPGVRSDGGPRPAGRGDRRGDRAGGRLPAGGIGRSGAGCGPDRRAGLRGARMRARYPDVDGYVDRDGVKLFYEVYGEGEPTILLAPLGWPIVHSRMWKAQIPFLSRSRRVVTYDPRGNGRSDRPTASEAFADRELAADALAV